MSIKYEFTEEELKQLLELLSVKLIARYTDYTMSDGDIAEASELEVSAFLAEVKHSLPFKIESPNKK